MAPFLLLIALCRLAWCSNVPAVAGRASVNYLSPDLWATSFSASGAKVPINAYRTTVPLLQSTTYTPECSLWVTYGYAEVVRQTVKSNTLNRQPTIFHFSSSGFSMDIDFVRKTQKVDLAKAASLKCNCSIAAHQVGRLLPSRINCSIQLHDSQGKHVLEGQVEDLQTHPYSVLFNASLREDNDSNNNYNTTAILNVLHSLNDPAGEVDELRDIVCDADFHAAEIRKQYWSLTTALRHRFTFSVRKTNFYLLDEGETGTDTSENLESDCPAFRNKPWRNVISNSDIPRAAHIGDCKALHFTQIDGVTIALYEFNFSSRQWHEAKAICESIGWKLARLKTENLWNGALLLAGRSDLNLQMRIWVGARLDSDWRWRWYNTSSQVARDTWCSNHPYQGHSVSYVSSRFQGSQSAPQCLYGEASGNTYAMYFMCTND